MTIRPKILALLTALSVGLFQSSAWAQGTPTPSPYQTVLDSNGNPISGAKVCTYTAGTTTPVATYTSSALSVANSNPIVTDTAGRYTAWLQPGASYKFITQNNDGTAGTCNGTVLKTVDGISAVPGSAANLDITGTAGETLTAGQMVYLSDGSGAKAAGQWFKADSANTYSSSTPEVGFVPNSIASGATGTIRISGSVTGLSSLTIGTTYYVGTAGAVTASAPTNSRFLGVADSTTTLVLTPNPPISAVAIANNISQGRLTLTTGTPVTISDVTAATTLRYAPYAGNLIALYNGTVWTLFTFPELSIAVPATTSQMYDVFVYDNAGTRTLELLAWTNDTTRATALVTQDGVLCKTGALTRRYVGSFRTTTVSGQTEDSKTKRFVWNYYNRVRRQLWVTDATASWSYGTATWRQVRATATNQVEVVIGVAESTLLLTATEMNSGGSGPFYTGVGLDSTSAPATGSVLMGSGPSAGEVIGYSGFANLMPAVGYHFLAWLEKGGGVAATITGASETGLTGLIEG